MRSRRAVLCGIVLLLWASMAQADRRNFVWNYQYMTMPDGSTELELYQTMRLNRPPDERDNWEFRLEVEHGLSERWDFSVYQIFSQAEASGSFKWDAVQFRTRYRIGEEGQYVLDPLLYFEYQRPLATSRPNKYEAKLILAKTQAPWFFAMNPLYELFAGPDTEHELGLDLGGGYEFSPRFSVGLESTSRVEFEDGESELVSFLGPTVSFASGEWWYSIGAAGRISEEKPGLESARIRFLMGIGL